MRLALGFAIAAALAGVARADEPVPPSEPPPPEQPEKAPAPAEETFDKPALRPLVRAREIVVEVPGERSRTNKLVLGSMAVAGVLFSGIAVKYHLDSRDAADAVSAGVFTGRPWSPELQAEVDRAADARRNATLGYSIGGALLVAAVVTFIATEPKSSREVMRPHLSLSQHGATMGGTWSW
jgi:hypothetical protein